MQAFYNNFFFNQIALLMISSIKFLHVSLIWDMLSHACELSGPKSFSNHIQNAQDDYKTKLELHCLLIKNSFL